MGTAANGQAAVDIIRKQSLDVVFLDINMPGLSGLEVVRTVGPQKMPTTVFVTAYDQHAVEAFRLAAIDYLLKPIDDEEFADTLDRIRQRQSRGEFAALVDESSAQRIAKYPTRLAVPERGQTTYVEADSIRYVTARTCTRSFIRQSVRSSSAERCSRLQTTSIPRISSGYIGLRLCASVSSRQSTLDRRETISLSLMTVHSLGWRGDDAFISRHSCAHPAASADTCYVQPRNVLLHFTTTRTTTTSHARFCVTAHTSFECFNHETQNRVFSEQQRRSRRHAARGNQLAPGAPGAHDGHGSHDDRIDHDDEPIGLVISRREALGLFAAPAVLLLAGCSSAATDDQPLTGTCVVRPSLTEGPYYVDENLNRADLRADSVSGAVRPGSTLDLTFNVSRVDGSSCAPCRTQLSMFGMQMRWEAIRT